MSSFYDFSGYALDNGLPRDTITADTKPTPNASETSDMENFLHDAWEVASELHSKLTLAQQAQEEDDKAGEELDRSKEEFVKRIGELIILNAHIQQRIQGIIYEHNHR